MEQLIVMKQRIKTVETIKKVTHAMRLISMSSHTRLLDKRKHLEEYQHTFQELWSSVQHVLSPLPENLHDDYAKDLCIIVSSQKGLCGTFNTSLFKFFEQDVPKVPKHMHIIAIGQFAADYLKRHKVTPLASYTTLSPQHFVSIAQAVTNLIMENPTMYRTVTAYGNREKTFFVQQPHKTILYPFKTPDTRKESQTPYLFEQSSELLRDTISRLLLSVSLQHLLFESLLSEQAARFISMDTSTRNADNLITTMKLGYNKVRQAGITRELSELSATLTD